LSFNSSRVYTLGMGRALAILVVCLSSPAAGAAQVASGAITGVVTDQQGAPVPGATVTVTNAATGRQRVLVSNQDGVFAAATMAPGKYRVDVTLTGFKPVVQSGVRIATGETLRLDVQLIARDVHEQVTVTASPAPLRTDTASLGATIGNEGVVGLPLNGRTFITLAQLAPGVALPPGSQLPRINGGRPRTNEYLFDGISALQPEPGQVAYFPVIDAIEEFRVETNSPPAEFGRFNGGVINLTTRSGSNTFSGNVFEFLRHEDLNARNFFQSSGPKPEYRRSQFGGTAGGPLQRSRTFFFADYQGQRQTIARTVISTVPTLLQRQGVFTEPIAGKVPTIFDPSSGSVRTPFAGNAIPTGQIDPVALSLIFRYPLPTSNGTANNFRRAALEADNQDQGDVRLDHAMTNRDQIFGRLTYFHDDFVPVTPLPDGSGVTTGTLGPQKTSSWAFAGHSQHTFSSRLVNELRFGDTRRSVDRTAAATLEAATGSSLQMPGIPGNTRFPDTLPTFLISGYQQLGSPPNTASTFSTSVTQAEDTVTWLRGKHLVRAGLDFRWERLDVVQPPSPTGSFTFNAIGSDQPGATGTGTPFASFLLGQVQAFSIDLQQEVIRERAKSQEYFVQDEWQIASRLTLTPGLRYTLNFPSREIDGQTAVFNLNTGVLDYPGAHGVRPLKKDNFGPRFGATYRATDRTILSAGYGLIWIEMAGITTPFTTPMFPYLQTVSQRALDTVSPAFLLQDGPTIAPLPPGPLAGLGQGVFTVDPTLGSGYAQQWNASVQRALTHSLTVEASYVGSIITHVGIPDTNLNQLTADQLAQGASLLQRVPNPYFGIIPRSSSLGDPTITVAQLMKPFPEYTTVSRYRNNVGTTLYRGLELSVRQHLAHGLTYSAAYTRSRLLDDASSVFDASILTGPIANYPVADSFNRRLERDYSTGDTPNVFVASGAWNFQLTGAVLGNWTVTGIVTLQSGMPVAITQTTNFNAFAGFGVQRPNLVGNPTLPPDQRTPTQWFNTAAFAVAPQFTIGTASRNPVRGPAYRDVDLALMKRVPIGGARSIEFRAEAFNLLNATPFGQPAGALGAANFGTITSAGDPRVIQLAVKVAF